jgi:hypothetical protein
MRPIKFRAQDTHCKEWRALAAGSSSPPREVRYEPVMKMRLPAKGFAPRAHRTSIARNSFVRGSAINALAAFSNGAESVQKNGK